MVFDPLLEHMDVQEGHSNIPPERLLKAKLLIAFYSVRSETSSYEQIGDSLALRLGFSITSAYEEEPLRPPFSSAGCGLSVSRVRGGVQTGAG